MLGSPLFESLSLVIHLAWHSLYMDAHNEVGGSVQLIKLVSDCG